MPSCSLNMLLLSLSILQKQKQRMNKKEEKQRLGFAVIVQFIIYSDTETKQTMNVSVTLQTT